MALAEAYADELQDGVDLMPHGGGSQSDNVNMYVWAILVGSIAALWLLGGVAFRSVNQ